MSNSFVKQLDAQLRKIAESACPLGNGEVGNFQMHDGVAYSLSNDAYISFNDMIGKIIKHKDFSQRFSSKYIDKKVKRILAKLLVGDAPCLEDEISGLLSELSNFNQERVVYLKVEGITLSACFELGRVRFVPGDECLLSEMKAKAISIIETTKNNDESKNSYFKLFEQQAESEFRGHCVGVVAVNAEPGRAFEIAKEEVRRAVDLLRFSSKAIYPLKEDVRIGLKGDHPKTNRQGLIFSGSEINSQGDSVGSNLFFEINQDSLERMSAIGVFEVSNALKKKQASNFEESIIKSIHWFSVALTQQENSNSFLFLIVALESLFKAERGNSIGGTVAESVAFLISDNLAGRKKIVALVREYYGKRSGVAHGGNKTISDSDLYNLINIAGSAIMVAIDKISKFSSQAQFMGWIEDQKLS